MSDANYDVEGLYDDDEENCFDEALMEELWERRTEMTEMKAQMKQLTKERDEARREVSELKANEANRLSSAVRLKGWICFEEETP
jgi:predicted ribonuclease toxin of YeeF-YezG toxin-antitoxin module